MVDFVPFLTRTGANAIDRGAGPGANKVATPINSFISKVNNVFGTNIHTVNPVALGKEVLNSAIADIFGRTPQGGRPSATQGRARLTQAVNVSNYSGGRQPTPIETAGKTLARQNVLNEMSKRFDPVTNFEWIAVIRNRGTQNMILPWYYVDEITIPLANFASTQKYINGREVKYADMFSVNTCTAKIYSDVSGMAFNYSDHWCKSVYRDDNLYQMPSEYKKDVWIFILDITRQVVMNVQLIGVWPSAWADYQLVGNSAAHLETSLTLSVDDFKMNYSDDPEDIAAKITRSTTGSTGTGEGVSGAAPSGAPGKASSFGSQNIGGGMMNNIVSDLGSTLNSSLPAGAKDLKSIVGPGGVTYALNNAANKAINSISKGALNSILKF